MLPNPGVNSESKTKHRKDTMIIVVCHRSRKNKLEQVHHALAIPVKILILRLHYQLLSTSQYLFCGCGSTKVILRIITSTAFSTYLASPHCVLCKYTMITWEERDSKAITSSVAYPFTYSLSPSSTSSFWSLLCHGPSLPFIFFLSSGCLSLRIQEHTLPLP